MWRTSRKVNESSSCTAPWISRAPAAAHSTRQLNVSFVEVILNSVSDSSAPLGTTHTKLSKSKCLEFQGRTNTDHCVGPPVQYTNSAATKVIITAYHYQMTSSIIIPACILWAPLTRAPVTPASPDKRRQPIVAVGTPRVTRTACSLHERDWFTPLANF